MSKYKKIKSPPPNRISKNALVVLLLGSVGVGEKYNLFVIPCSLVGFIIFILSVEVAKEFPVYSPITLTGAGLIFILLMITGLALDGVIK